MSGSQVIVLIIAILAFNALMWMGLVYWMKRRIGAMKASMREEYGGRNGKLIIEPQSALYRGGTTRFGNVRGNGVICLTEAGLIFKKVTGQKIEIRRTEIKEAIVGEWFEGKPSFATGGKHLIIRTTDGSRVGFLLRDAEQWPKKIKAS